MTGREVSLVVCGVEVVGGACFLVVVLVCADETLMCYDHLS
mgnify:CR=1 FL=1